MSYHITNLGSAVTNKLQGCADMDGFIAEHGDDIWTFRYDHGTENTHNTDGSLTEYGEWFRDEQWPKIVDTAVAETSVKPTF